MNTFKKILIILLVSTTNAVAAPVSEESVQKLLAVTKAQQLVKNMQDQVLGQFKARIALSLKGQKPSAKEQQAFTNMQNKMASLIQSTLDWKKLEPTYIELYKETFTEEEMSGMLSFYETPAGQAVINKMPLLVEKTMMQMQSTMSTITPQTEQILIEFRDEIKAANSKSK